MLRNILIFLLLLLSCVTVYAADDESPFNIDAFFGWDSYYRPMEWTPVEISLSSTLAEPFAGRISISSAQDGQNNLNISSSLVITPNITEYLPMVTKIAFGADQCNINLLNDRDRIELSNKYDFLDYSSGARMLTTVSENSLLIGLVGYSKFDLARLPEQTICINLSDIGGINNINSRISTPSNIGRLTPAISRSGGVYIGSKQVRMVPWDWTGFVSLDLLILYEPDWDSFNENQLNAISQWVSNGGKLFVILGSKPYPQSNPLADIIPCDFEQVREINLSFENLMTCGLAYNTTEEVVCQPIVIHNDAMILKTETNDLNKCFFVLANSGFGSVGVLSFDPIELSSRQRQNSGRFWTHYIQAILDNSRQQVNVPDSSYRTIEFISDPNNMNRAYSNPYQYNIGQSLQANNQIMEFFLQQIQPLSIWSIIILLAALAILVGPLDYFVLKKLDRLPLTWLSCSLWIIIFTAGAYYGVQYLRGGSMELKAVSIIDGIKGSPHKWETNYCGFFAPRSEDYQLEGLKANQWWSGFAATQESMWAYNQQLVTRDIYCRQSDGSNLPDSLPVNIWTVQSLINESLIEQMPFDADVTIAGDELIVNINNESDSAVRDGYVILSDKRGIFFRNIPANSRRELRQKIRVSDAYSLDWRLGIDSFTSLDRKSIFSSQGTIQRTKSMKNYLAQGAAVICLEYEDSPTPITIKDHDCNYVHIQWARLVVFPQELDTIQEES